MSEPDFETMYRWCVDNNQTKGLPVEEVKSRYAAAHPADPVAEAVRECARTLFVHRHDALSPAVIEGDIREHLGPWLPTPQTLKALREWAHLSDFPQGDTASQRLWDAMPVAWKEGR